MDLPSVVQLLVTGGVTLGMTALILSRLFPWLRYDIHFLRVMVAGAITFKRYEAKNMLLIDIFEKKASEIPKKTFLLFEDQKFTYEEMNERANKAANTALSLGIRRGDVVAVLMYNEPAFIWTYFGLLKIGAEAAFLNFNLRSKSLLHCFNVSEASTLIVGQGKELTEAVSEIYADLSTNNNDLNVYVQGAEQGDLPEGFTAYDPMFEKAPSGRISRTMRDGINFKSTANYIYTSGTTGLPKAAVVTQAKVIKGAVLVDTVNPRHDDVIYTPLPLYHSAAGIIALGSTVHNGATLALRNKFSATQFFPDCKKYNVTIIQYIGELCRYLMARPPSAADRDHKVRVAFGNGLRADIWREFQERFNIPQIGEFYAATEGNAGFINFFNKQGAIGRASPLLSALVPVYMIKYNVAEDRAERTPDGLCITCKPGEPGLMVSQIKRDFEFDGYKGNKELSEKKVLRDVFKKGDVYFNTGDLLLLDENYFVYFNDRIGDTFRWKGENVSTIEVSNVVSDVSWIEDACVYGVQIPEQDGRCGMAAITLVEETTVDEDKLRALYAHCSDLLPAYALPRFLRFQKHMQITGTFKQQKFNLVKDGYLPSKCGDDSLYCADFANKTFQPITEETVEAINSGKIRL